MMNHRRSSIAGAVLTMFMSTLVSAGDFSIDRYTIDGGGGYSAGGNFEVDGTIGQPDAGSAMTGGEFTLTGGFWPAAVPSCACPGDMTGDGVKNGIDIQEFLNCLIVGGNCGCADLDGTDGVTIADMDLFVLELLTDSSCP